MILVALVIFGISNAQENEPTYGFKKTDFFIDGTISYSSNDSDFFTTTINNNVPEIVAQEQRASIFIISSKAGYFVSNHFALGVNIGYISINVNSDNGLDSDTDGFNIGSFGRYYYTPQKRFSIFNTLTANYINQQAAFLDTNGFNIGIDTGIHYFLSEHFIIQSFIGFLSYQNTTTDFDNGPSIDTDSFSIALNFRNINFGLAYKF